MHQQVGVQKNDQKKLNKGRIFYVHVKFELEQKKTYTSSNGFFWNLPIQILKKKVQREIKNRNQTLK